MNGTWPWVKTQELNDGRIDDSEEHITDEAILNSAAKVLPTNTILMAMYGATVGKLGILGRPMTCNQACCAMVVDEDIADYQFLYYLLLYFRPQIVGLATGAAQQNLSGQTIRQFAFQFPPLPEQRRIAHILGTLDDKIEINRQMNQTLDEIARTRFRSWFVDFDPVRAKMEGRQPDGMDAATAALFPDRLVDSELGPIPEGWEWGELADVADNIRDSVAADELDPDEVYVGLEHFERRHIALYEWGSASDLASNKSRFQENDILFGKLRPYFHKVSVAPVDGVCSTELFVIRPNRPADLPWIASIASSDAMIEHATQRSTGTRMPRANWKDVGGFSIAISDVTVRVAFGQSLRPMLELIKSNVMESRTLASLRDTLLPELLQPTDSPLECP